jgi:ribosomal protein S18 acetylase RimI-like enzyme
LVSKYLNDGKEMNNIKIRMAEPADIELLHEILGEADKLHRDAHPEIFRKIDDIEGMTDYYHSCMKNPDALICVAEVDSCVVGAMICMVYKSADILVLVPRKFACIENISVLESYRRKGIGKTLVHFAQKWAKKQDAAAVELTVWEFNRGASAFYRQLGFETVRSRLSKDLP